MATVKHPHIHDYVIEVADEKKAEYLAAGWQDTEAAPDPEGGVLERPAGNASREEWYAYALARGADAEGIADYSRDQLRDAYAG